MTRLIFSSTFSSRSILCTVVIVLLSLTGTSQGIDSINMNLESLENIDLSALGTPNLDRYSATYNLTVDDTCRYLFKLIFKGHSEDTPGDESFTGVCEPDTDTGVAPDGIAWHATRRHWLQLPEYVQAATGFNHMALYWRPCGQAPGGFRQARYDINFYTVLPQYRAYMVCQEFKTPAVCQYNQSNHLGRGFFSLPRLERDPNFLANMPLRFQPDPEAPEAFQYEGLVHYDKEKVPATPEDWALPSFLMSTYDGDVVSWRTMLPHEFVSGSKSSNYYGEQYYVFQTMLRLPSSWNMTYDSPTGEISLSVQGSAGMCGASFEQAKAESDTIAIVVGTDGGEGPTR